MQNFKESETLVPNKARLKPSVPNFARCQVKKCKIRVYKDNYNYGRLFLMRKIVWMVLISVVVALTNCGGQSSKEAKALLSHILNIIGIPQSMIVNICQDGNANGLCDPFELDNISLQKISFLTK